MRAIAGWSLAIAAILLMAASAPRAFADDPVRVSAYGQVDHPGESLLPGKPRLSDAVVAAQVNRNAYVVGAAWLRPGLMDQQVRLKAGLLYQLRTLEESAGDKHGRAALAPLAKRLHAWFDAMPVTGRMIVRTLEPHVLQMDGADNVLVADGDRLVYPSRPDFVSVVGAVVQNCQLPLAPLQDVRAYVVRCAPAAYSDPDWAWVIQPDGSVSKVGLSLWNRTPLQAVAPGAIVLVPVKRGMFSSDADDELNKDMAAFLATQPVGGTGANP